MSKAAAIEDYLARLKDSPVSLEDFGKITISLPKDKSTPPTNSPAFPWAIALASALAGAGVVGISWVLVS